MITIKRILLGAGICGLALSLFIAGAYVSEHGSQLINDIVGWAIIAILSIALFYCIGGIFIRADGEA